MPLNYGIEFEFESQFVFHQPHQMRTFMAFGFFVLRFSALLMHKHGGIQFVGHV